MKRIVLVSYFFGIALLGLFLHQTGQWIYFNDNTVSDVNEVEQPINIDDVERLTGKAPNLKKEYFRKVEVTEVTRTSIFPFLENTSSEKDLGIFSRVKKQK